MKLRYRGVPYEYEPPQLEIVEGGVGGTYRGANWKVRTLLTNPVRQLSALLSYRGVTYHTNPAEAKQPTMPVAAQETTQPVGNAVSATGPNFFGRRRRVSDLEQAHRTTILKQLEHRLQVARERGDEKLIHQLEAEWRQFA